MQKNNRPAIKIKGWKLLSECNNKKTVINLKQGVYTRKKKQDEVAFFYSMSLRDDNNNVFFLHYISKSSIVQDGILHLYSVFYKIITTDLSNKQLFVSSLFHSNIKE